MPNTTTMVAVELVVPLNIVAAIIAGLRGDPNRRDEL